MNKMIILLALACAGCGAGAELGEKLAKVELQWEKVEKLNNGLYGYVDEKTGCEYLSNGRGLAPRMGADGKQICGARP